VHLVECRSRLISQRLAPAYPKRVRALTLIEPVHGDAQAKAAWTLIEIGDCDCLEKYCGGVT